MQEAPDPSQARTTPALVAAAAARFGDAPALEEGDTRLSFRALHAAVQRATRAFIASGIEPGDRIAIWAPNIHEWMLAALGLQGAGAVLVPLNTRLKGAEAGYILRKAGVRMLCTVRDFLDTDYVALLEGESLPELEQVLVLRGGAGDALSWDAFLARADNVSDAQAQARSDAVTPDDLCDILFTSGTTGKPKGAVSAHGQTLRAFEVWSEVVGLRSDDRYLIVMPFFHAFGYKAGFLSALMRGATILPHAVFDAAAVLERVVKERVSVLPGPPTIYESFLAHPERASFDLKLRLAVTGAAPTPVELIRRMRDELGFETIITGYGLTECCGIVSMCRFDDDPETIATTSGRAIPGVEVRCVDAEGAEVPRGEPGEIWVRGYNVMRGYLEDPDATAETIDAEGWLHTGDIAVMDERGYLQITGRIKDMFIMGGFNCYPAEIEALMFGSGEFAQVAVVGVPDTRMGEVGFAFAVPAPDRSPTPESVIAWCREHMANYKVPRHVAFVDALPINAGGKVMKNQLKEQALERLGT